MSYFGIPIRNGLPIGLGSVAPLASGGGSPFSPLSLFSGGTPGAWYDPSDYSTLFQDSAGTTPVTAVEQPVGLMLDKSQGLVLGSELVTNGDFATDTGWTKGGSWTISGGSANWGGGADAFLQQSLTIPVAANVQIQFTISGLTSGSVGLREMNNLGANLAQYTSNGTFVAYDRVPSTSGICAFRAQSLNAGASIDNVSVKVIAGNHAFQATSASRPVLSARYNLLTKTEQFDDAAWSPSNVQARTAVTAPDGTSTAYAVIQNTATGIHGVSQAVNISAASMTFTVIAKTAVGSSSGRFVLRNGADGSYATFDLNSETVVSSGPGTATITPYGSGWYTCTLVYTGTAVSSSQQIFLGQSTSTGGGGVYSFAGDGTSGVYVWHPQVVPSNQSTIPYQRVNTATDYATTGFLPYLKFDGVDDSLSTNSISFTSTDKMSVFAGVRKLSDAALYGTVAELSASYSSNNGAFTLNAPAAINTGTYLFALRGTDNTGYEPTGYASPLTNVLAASFNIAGASRVTEVFPRINGVLSQVGPVGSADAGTGNFGNYPLYIGRRNNASLPFNGQLYSMVIVGKAVTAGELTNTETYVNQKTGAY